MATVEQIGRLVNASPPYHEDAELIAVSSIASATRNTVVFAADSKSLALALDSSAGLILVTRKCAIEETSDKRLLIVPDARYAFAQVARELQGLNKPTKIHQTAVVHASVRVGESTTIAAGCVVGENVLIGHFCEVGPNVTIYANTTVGDRVNVQAGAVLGAKGFGYVKNADTGEYLLFPQQGTLAIEDDVDIGANTTIDRGALGETRIGRGSKLDNLVHIGHNCSIGKNVIIAAQTGISGSSVIEDGAILGGQVGVGEHAVVGRGVILGGGSGVLSKKKMHGPGEVFWGRPARPLKEYLKDLARSKKR